MGRLLRACTIGIAVLALATAGMTPAAAEEPTYVLSNLQAVVTGFDSDTYLTVEVSWDWSGPDPHEFRISLSGGGGGLFIVAGDQRSETITPSFLEYSIQVTGVDSDEKQLAQKFIEVDWRPPVTPAADELELICDTGAVSLYHDGALVTLTDGVTWSTNYQAQDHIGGFSLDECPWADEPPVTVDVRYVREATPAQGGPHYIPADDIRSLVVTPIPLISGEITNALATIEAIKQPASPEVEGLEVGFSWDWAGDGTPDFFIVTPDGEISSSGSPHALFLPGITDHSGYSVVARHRNTQVASAEFPTITASLPQDPPDDGLTATCTDGEITLRFGDEEMNPAVFSDRFDADGWTSPESEECPDATVEVRFYRIINSDPALKALSAPVEAPLVAPPDDGPGDGGPWSPGGGPSPPASAQGGDRSSEASGSAPLPGIPPAEAAEDTPVGFIHRLYLGLFGRVADDSGLDYWVSRAEAGHTPQQIIASVLATPEARSLISGLTDAELVSFLYDQILGRDSDLGGYNHWLAQLTQGRISRAGLVAAFVNSSELHHRVTNALAS